MPYGKSITVTKDGQKAVVHERSWSVYERNGWTRAEDTSLPLESSDGEDKEDVPG
jgi:hypothetical protein